MNSQRRRGLAVLPQVISSKQPTQAVLAREPEGETVTEVVTETVPVTEADTVNGVRVMDELYDGDSELEGVTETVPVTEGLMEMELDTEVLTVIDGLIERLLE